MSNTYLNLTGAQLRAMAAGNDAGAQAELARRAAKREASGKWTVAAAMSQGRDDIAAQKIAQAAASRAARQQQVAFARSVEKVAKPKAVKPQRVTVASLDARIAKMETAIALIASKLA